MPYKMQTYLPDVNAFPFQNLVLADPTPIHGLAGFYSTKLSVGQNGSPLYVQLPQCITKDAFLSTKTGKYCDLQYERLPNTGLVAFFEQIEFTCQDLIDGQKNKWFQNELTHDDIENMMASVTRTYQSGKYILIRTFLPPNLPGGQKFVAYNEKEIGVDLDNIKPSHQVIPLLLIDGVKFSSKSFEIDLKLIQLMVLNEVSSSQILIKRGLPPTISSTSGVHDVNGTTQVLAEPTSESGNNVLAKANQFVDDTLTTTVDDKHSTIVDDKHTTTVDDKHCTTVDDKHTTTVDDKHTTTVDDKQPTTSNSVESANANSVVAPESSGLANAEEVKVHEKNSTADSITSLALVETPLIEPTTTTTTTNTSSNTVEVVTFDFDTSSSLTSLEAMTLKKPNEVYYDIYAAARQKAKGLRKEAIEAYLLAKEIKTKYMLDDLVSESSSSSSSEDEDDEEDEDDDQDDDDDEEAEEDEEPRKDKY